MSFTYNFEDFEIINKQKNHFEVTFTDGEETLKKTFHIINKYELEALKIMQLESLCNNLDDIKLEYGSIYDSNGMINIQKIIDEE